MKTNISFHRLKTYRIRPDGSLKLVRTECVRDDMHFDLNRYLSVFRRRNVLDQQQSRIMEELTEELVDNAIRESE